jgi:hypothetical protein
VLKKKGHFFFIIKKENKIKFKQLKKITRTFENLYEWSVSQFYTTIPAASPWVSVKGHFRFEFVGRSFEGWKKQKKKKMKLQKTSDLPDSNQRPKDIDRTNPLQSSALPTELRSVCYFWPIYNIYLFTHRPNLPSLAHYIYLFIN